MTEVFQQQLRRELSRQLIELAGRSGLGAESFQQPLNAAEAEAVWNELPVEYARDPASSPVEATVAAMLVQIHSILRTQRGSADYVSGPSYSPGDGAAMPAFVQSVAAMHRRRWSQHVSRLNRMLHDRAVPTWLHLVRDECLARAAILDADLVAIQDQIRQTRTAPPVIHDEQEHHGLAPAAPLPFIDPHPQLGALRRRVIEEFAGTVSLLPHDADSLSGFGGEMDRVLQMPGWTNVWTRPIQNRVDMLATGVNTELGIRVLGRNLDDVLETSQQLASVLTEVPGTADVIACFGMAAATGIVMLVYLREAVELAGGLENMTLTQLRKAVLDGAVHRLRPKLLTEATTILSLAPMLWSDGVGAEVIRPMAAPVLGGILIADEVIDLLLPILFYHTRRRRWHRLHNVKPVASPEIDARVHGIRELSNPTSQRR